MLFHPSWANFVTTYSARCFFVFPPVHFLLHLLAGPLHIVFYFLSFASIMVCPRVVPPWYKYYCFACLLIVIFACLPPALTISVPLPLLPLFFSLLFARQAFVTVTTAEQRRAIADCEAITGRKRKGIVEYLSEPDSNSDSDEDFSFRGESVTYPGVLFLPQLVCDPL